MTNFVMKEADIILATGVMQGKLYPGEEEFLGWIAVHRKPAALSGVEEGSGLLGGVPYLAGRMGFVRSLME